MLSVVLSIFGETHRDLFFLVNKVTISEMTTDILRKFVVLTMFEKWQILRKIWICLNKCFYQTIKRAKILTKTVFLPKVRHKLINYATLLFWSIFEDIHRELLILVKKVTISETSTETHRKFVFLTMFGKEQNLLKILISLNNFFWLNQLQGGKY